MSIDLPSKFPSFSFDPEDKKASAELKTQYEIATSGAGALLKPRLENFKKNAIANIKKMPSAFNEFLNKIDAELQKLQSKAVTSVSQTRDLSPQHRTTSASISGLPPQHRPSGSKSKTGKAFSFEIPPGGLSVTQPPPPDKKPAPTEAPKTDYDPEMVQLIGNYIPLIDRTIDGIHQCYYDGKLPKTSKALFRELDDRLRPNGDFSRLRAIPGRSATINQVINNWWTARIIEGIIGDVDYALSKESILQRWKPPKEIATILDGWKPGINDQEIIQKLRVQFKDRMQDIGTNLEQVAFSLTAITFSSDANTIKSPIEDIHSYLNTGQSSLNVIARKMDRIRDPLLRMRKCLPEPQKEIIDAVLSNSHDLIKGSMNPDSTSKPLTIKRLEIIRNNLDYLSKLDLANFERPGESLDLTAALPESETERVEAEEKEEDISHRQVERVLFGPRAGVQNPEDSDGLDLGKSERTYSSLAQAKPPPPPPITVPESRGMFEDLNLDTPPHLARKELTREELLADTPVGSQSPASAIPEVDTSKATPGKELFERYANMDSKALVEKLDEIVEKLNEYKKQHESTMESYAGDQIDLIKHTIELYKKEKDSLLPGAIADQLSTLAASL